MAARACLFDVDGTLWQSAPWLARVISGASSASYGDIREALEAGRSVISIARAHGLSRAQLAAACRDTGDELEAFPGVRTGLETLRSSAVPMGIVSTLSPALLLPLLDITDLAEFFAAVIHPGNCRGYKPSPEPLLACLRALSVQPSKESWYVGDREVDAQAAKRAGLRFAWAAYSGGPSVLPRDAVLRSFADLVPLVA